MYVFIAILLHWTQHQSRYIRFSVSHHETGKTEYWVNSVVISSMETQKRVSLNILFPFTEHEKQKNRKRFLFPFFCFCDFWFPFCTTKNEIATHFVLCDFWFLISLTKTDNWRPPSTFRKTNNCTSVKYLKLAQIISKRCQFEEPKCGRGRTKN